MRIIKMKYFYGMRLRGFSPGCQPMEHFVERINSEAVSYHDVIIYDRPLPDEDVKHYSLTPVYGLEYSDNTGESFYDWFPTLEQVCLRITRELQNAYDRYCNEAPSADVTWVNRYLDCGNTAEVYVPGSDLFTRCEFSAPVESITSYIKKNQNAPVSIGKVIFRLTGVNCLDNEDVNRKVAYDDDEAYSYKERYAKAVKELEEDTKGMSIEDAYKYFKDNAEDDNANYYGNWVYVYTSKFNGKYLTFGVRMD